MNTGQWGSNITPGDMSELDLHLLEDFIQWPGPELLAGYGAPGEELSDSTFETSSPLDSSTTTLSTNAACTPTTTTTTTTASTTAVAAAALGSLPDNKGPSNLFNVTNHAQVPTLSVAGNETQLPALSSSPPPLPLQHDDSNNPILPILPDVAGLVSSLSPTVVQARGEYLMAKYPKTLTSSSPSSSSPPSSSIPVPAPVPEPPTPEVPQQVPLSVPRVRTRRRRRAPRSRSGAPSPTVNKLDFSPLLTFPSPTANMNPRLVGPFYNALGTALKMLILPGRRPMLLGDFGDDEDQPPLLFTVEGMLQVLKGVWNFRIQDAQNQWKEVKGKNGRTRPRHHDDGDSQLQESMKCIQAISVELFHRYISGRSAIAFLNTNAEARTIDEWIPLLYGRWEKVVSGCKTAHVEHYDSTRSQPTEPSEQEETDLPVLSKPQRGHVFPVRQGAVAKRRSPLSGNPDTPLVPDDDTSNSDSDSSSYSWLSSDVEDTDSSEDTARVPGSDSDDGWLL